MPLYSHLAAPVQRLCKYPLLLRELLANMDADHPEHASLTDARASLEDIVNRVNARARQVENVKRIEDIVQSMRAAPKVRNERFDLHVRVLR